MSESEPNSDQNNQDEKIKRLIELALEAEKPRGPIINVPYNLIKRIYNPVVLGESNVPREPCMFVGNHALFATDGAILGPIMIKEMGRFPRFLGDRFLFENEQLAENITKIGGVLGHPDICDALMEHGHDVVVYPGGAREAVKAEKQRYQLLWQGRYGFVRMAAKHGYSIQPVAMVGPDEFFRHRIESKDFPDSWLGKALKQMGLLAEDTRPDTIPPLPAGILGTLIPKPQRCFIEFGKPISMAEYKGKEMTERQLKAIHRKVTNEIEERLANLLLYREQHRGEEGLLRRILTL